MVFIMFPDGVERILLYPLNEIKKRSSLAATSAAALAIIIMLVVWYLATPYYNPTPQNYQGSPLVVTSSKTYGAYFFRTGVDEVDVKVGKVPQYRLPLTPESIENFQDFIKLGFSDDVINKLLENGFVVTFYAYSEDMLSDFVEYYRNLPRNIPRFITSDMMLHVFHSLFASLLMNSEESYFIPWLNETLKSLLQEAVQLYVSDSKTSKIITEALIRLIAYLIVPIKLLDPSYQPPSNTPTVSIALANLELGNIKNHADFSQSPIMKHLEDYTQYIPRGYYTINKNLTRYFLAAMYLGRMYFPVFSTNSTFADVATAAALILTKLVYETKVTGIEGTPTAFEIYEKIYYTTAFFVGYSDDLTFQDYAKVIHTVFGEDATYGSFSDSAKLHEAEQLLINLDHSKISAVGASRSIFEIGLRFMGQRFILDSYIFQKLVDPEVKGRMLPTALDIAAAFGSSRAKYNLGDEFSKYPDYPEALDNVSKEVKSFNVTSWTWNLYNGWLYTINSTLKESYNGYPTFMQTDAWKDEKLNTFFGSWSELRHDTILYAKQSYTRVTAIPMPSGEGFVEPLPLLWSRLKGLTLQMKVGLDALGILPVFYKDKLDFLYNELDFLLNVSVKELMNIPLNETEQNHIFGFADTLEYIMAGLRRANQKTTIVADVHTDPNTGLVLEEGVGYIHLIAAVFPTPDNKLKIALGPVFSHYEFTQPMSNRLTDELWEQMLSQGTAPEYPPWTNTYLVPP